MDQYGQHADMLSFLVKETVDAGLELPESIRDKADIFVPSPAPAPAAARMIAEAEEWAKGKTKDEIITADAELGALATGMLNAFKAKNPNVDTEALLTAGAPGLFGAPVPAPAPAPAPAPTPAPVPDLSAAEIEAMTLPHRACFACLDDTGPTVAATLRCGTCRTQWVCSKECQRKAWPAHKSECKKSKADDKSAAQLARVFQYTYITGPFLLDHPHLLAWTDDQLMQAARAITAATTAKEGKAIRDGAWHTMALHGMDALRIARRDRRHDSASTGAGASAATPEPATAAPAPAPAPTAGSDSPSSEDEDEPV